MTNKSGLTDEQLDQMADALRGTMRSIESYLDQYELPADMEAVQYDLLDYECEMCNECGYWYEPCELVCEHDEYGCEDCRECSKCE